jgi:hypothetical protein
MGIMKISVGSNSSTVSYNMVPFDLSKVKVLNEYITNHYKVFLLHYENCTTFEGKKILVFEGDEFCFEPHFSKDKKLIARFRPDMWSTAKSFVDYLENKYC